MHLQMERNLDKTLFKTIRPMLNKKVQDAINAQINAEFWSAYLYLSMSAYANAQGYKGMANWFEIQYQEELDHVKIFFDYILQRNGKVELQPIKKVPTEWTSPLNLFEETLKHEQVVTGLINNLYSLSLAENDFATQSMLKWFIDEQVEEEENAQDIIDKLKIIGDNGYGIYTLDKDLSTRVYTQAAPLTANN
jgi:ferritin